MSSVEESIGEEWVGIDSEEREDVGAGLMSKEGRELGTGVSGSFGGRVCWLNARSQENEEKNREKSLLVGIKLGIRVRQRRGSQLGSALGSLKWEERPKGGRERSHEEIWEWSLSGKPKSNERCSCAVA